MRLVDKSVYHRTHLKLTRPTVEIDQTERSRQPLPIYLTVLSGEMAKEGTGQDATDDDELPHYHDRRQI
nr:hypothetical protein [Escherichia coli]